MAEGEISAEMRSLRLSVDVFTRSSVALKKPSAQSRYHVPRLKLVATLVAVAPISRDVLWNWDPNFPRANWLWWP